MGFKIVLERENVISLRSAIVLDNGYVVSLKLTPQRWVTSIANAATHAKSESIWLYRRRWSRLRQMILGDGSGIEGMQQNSQAYLSHHKMHSVQKLMARLHLRRALTFVERDIKVVAFREDPIFQFLWEDSGQNVAVLINGVPWAFIHEKSNEGYSKGILRPTIGNIWDQGLFDRLFSGHQQK